MNRDPRRRVRPPSNSAPPSAGHPALLGRSWPRPSGRRRGGLSRRTSREPLPFKALAIATGTHRRVRAISANGANSSVFPLLVRWWHGANCRHGTWVDAWREEPASPRRRWCGLPAPSPLAGGTHEWWNSRQCAGNRCLASDVVCAPGSVYSAIPLTPTLCGGGQGVPSTP